MLFYAFVISVFNVQRSLHFTSSHLSVLRFFFLLSRPAVSLFAVLSANSKRQWTAKDTPFPTHPIAAFPQQKEVGSKVVNNVKCKKRLRKFVNGIWYSCVFYCKGAVYCSFSKISPPADINYNPPFVILRIKNVFTLPFFQICQTSFFFL